MAGNVGKIWYTVEADTSDLVNSSRDVNSSLVKVEGAMRKTDSAAGAFEGRMTRTAGAVRQANEQITAQSGAMSGLTRVIGTYLSLRTLQHIAQITDQYGQMASRIRGATSSEDEYNLVQERLLKTANTTYRSLSEAQEVYLSTSGILKDLGYNTGQVLDITDSLSFAFVRDAARADQAQSATDAYSKSLQKGKIDADAWASIMAAAPSIVDGISAATGRTGQEIRKLGVTGKLSLEALNEGLRRSRDQNEELANSMETSTQDATVRLSNALGVFLGRVNEAAGASRVFTENVDDLAQVLSDPKTIAAAVDLANGVIKAIREMVESTKREIQGLKSFFGSIGDSLNLEVDAGDVDRLQSKMSSLQETMQNMRDQGYGPGSAAFDNMEDSFRKVEARLARAQALQMEAERRAKPSSAGGGAAAPRAAVVSAEASSAGGDDSKALQSLREQAALAKLAGEERAKLAARQKLSADATAAEVAEAERLAVEIYRGNEARKDSGRQITAQSSAQKQYAEEARKGAIDNEKTIADLSQALALAGLKGQELAAAQALLRLNPYATPEQVAQVRALSDALYAVQEAEANKALLAQVDPMAAEQQRFETEMQNLKKLNDAKLLENDRFLELKKQAEQQHDEALQKLEEERFRRQSAGNEMLMSTLDEVGQASKEALVGLATGAANGEKAAQRFGAALLNNVVGSLVEVGLQQLKNFVMSQAQQAAAVSTAAATGAAMTAAYTPAAAAASVATFGGAAWAGLAAMASAIPSILGLFGGRQYGGPVAGNGLYQINENGAPEVLNAANGRQYLLPNTRGDVVSNSDARGSSGPVSVQIFNNGAPVQARAEMDGDTLRIFLDQAEQDFASKMTSGQGLYPRAIEGSYGLRRRGG